MDGVNAMAKRLPRLLGILLSVVLLFIGVERAHAVAVTRQPYLQQATPTSVIVRWRTDVATDSRVSIGPAPNSLMQNFDTGPVSTEHLVLVSALSPGTKYYYAVGSSGQRLAGGDSTYYFVTPPTAGTAASTRIWVTGDQGTGDYNSEAVRDAYLAFISGSRAADLWLSLGDIAETNNTTSDSDYQAFLFDPYPMILRNTVFWPTLGNHDAVTTNYATQTGPYYDIFTLPKTGEAGGTASGSESYYSFDYANIHFISLDSAAPDVSATGTMMTWLKQDIAATTQEWIIAFWHHSPYSHGSHNSDEELEMTLMRENAVPILEGAGVDLVLTGHSHNYERSFLIGGHYGTSDTFTNAMKVNGGSGRSYGSGAYVKALTRTPHGGAVYTVDGSSGVLGSPPGTLDYPAMYISAYTLGSMVLDVSGDRLDASFLTSTGAIGDWFTMMKVPDGSLPPAAPTELHASSAGTSRIDLTWSDNATNEDGYQVERSTDGVSFTQAAQLAANAVSYSDSGLLPVTTYFYRVRAYNASAASGYSNVASATTAAIDSRPYNLVGTAVSESQINLTWLNDSHDQDGFYLERSNDNTNFAAIATTANTEYADTGLTSGSQYFYRVRSYNSVGTSSYSNTVAVITQGGTPGFPASVVADAPVSYWRLNETGGTLATDSMGNNPGTYAGGYTQGLPGALGSDPDPAVLLNGTSGYIYAASSASLNRSDGQLTLEAWVKRNGSNRSDIIIHKGTGAYQLRFNLSDRLVLSKANTGDIVSSTITVTDNNWHHCAAAKNGSSVRLYLDGADVTGTVTNQTLVNATSSTLRLGTSSDTYFLGGLDEIAIYNYVLPAQRIAAHYRAASLPAAPSGLAAKAVTADQIDLSWTNNGGNSTGSYIERSVDGIHFVQIGGVVKDVAAYSDAGLNANVTYSYRVRSFNNSGTSGYSSVASATTSSLAPADAPVFTPPPGSYATGQTVSITDSTPGATIYYTSNGTTPTTSSPIYAGPITVSVTTTLRAIATASGYSQSAVSGGTYTITGSAATPVFSPAPGTYSSAQAVALSDSTAGAMVYYTTDGTTPSTFSPAYTAPITVSMNTTLKAIAVASGYAESAVATGVYNIRAATPVFSPAAGTYSGAQAVTLADATAGASIFYSSDGSMPTTSSLLYSGPISVSVTTTLKSIAAAAGYTESNVASAAYNIVPGAPSGLLAAASPTLTSEIDLTWTNAGGNATAVLIERSADGASFTQIASVGAAVSSYASIGLAAGTRYYYRVRAQNSAGYSGYSNVADATTGAVPAAPSGLAAAAVSRTQINLAWTNNASNATSIAIERSRGGRPYTQIASVSATAGSYSDAGLSSRTRYTYRVRARNGYGYSGYSNSATATTK
jgi:fibronectin type 3 domain-containing protein